MLKKRINVLYKMLNKSNVKSFLYIVYILILLTGISFRGIAQKNIPIQYQSEIKKKLSRWVKSISNLDLQSFIQTDTVLFRENGFHYPDTLKNFLRIYKNIVTWSPNKKKFLDIYSYILNLKLKKGKIVYEGGGEDHQAINICYKDNDEWAQVFFCGGSIRIQEGMWFSDEVFILVGVEKNDKTNKEAPFIVIGNYKKKHSLTYFTKKFNSLQKAEYYSPKIRNIRGLY